MQHNFPSLRAAVRLLAALLVAVAAAVGTADTAAAQNPVANQARKAQQRKAAPVGARAAQAPVRKAAPARKPVAAKPAANPAQTPKSKPKVKVDPVREAETADSAAVGTLKESTSASVPPKEEVVMDNALVEVPAAYPGGEMGVLRDVANNLRYPAIAMENGVQGKVILRFKVQADGLIGTVSIVRSLSHECDKAAMECVKKLKRFTPARQQGRAVPVWFTLPVNFRLQN